MTPSRPLWTNVIYGSPQRRKQRRDFYVSAAAPLWAECYPRGKGRARRFVEYLESQEATYGFPGGIPTSMSDSGQQWDFPNAWPPTTEILVTALRNAKEEYPVLYILIKLI